MSTNNLDTVSSLGREAISVRQLSSNATFKRSFIPSNEMENAGNPRICIIPGCRREETKSKRRYIHIKMCVINVRTLVIVAFT